jgi:CHAT domain-containing protein
VYRQRETGIGSEADALRQAQRALLHGSVQVASLPADVRAALKLGGAGSVPATFRPDSSAPFAHPYYWAPFILMGSWL